MLFTLLFILGLLIGSFLNVIALRFDPSRNMLGTRTLGGRSKCRGCSVTLRWYELVPLFSFIIQGARCRHCSHALAWQYPLVEAAAAILTATIPTALFSYFGGTQLTLQSEATVLYIYIGLWLLVAYTALVAAAIDLRLKIIPNQSNALLSILGLGLASLRVFNPEIFTGAGSFLGSYSGVFWFAGEPLLGTIAAALSALLIFGGIIYLSKGRGMGMGDVKLAIPMALILGWPDAILAFMAAFVIGAIFALVLLAYRVKQMREAIPFGPFLVMGLFVPLFYGEQLVRWYFSLI